MGNFKVRVNSEAESREVQELFFHLGYEWHGAGKSVSYLESSASGEFGYLVAWKPGCFSKYIIQMGCGKEDAKELTLSELRAMVNPSLNDQYAEIEKFRRDNVSNPSHYTQGKVECIDALESATIGKSGIEAVCVANVIKYLWRYEEKNGLEDVKKAQWYLERLVASMGS